MGRNMQSVPLFVCIAVLLAAVFMIGCTPRQNGNGGPETTPAPNAPSPQAPGNTGKGADAVGAFAVRTALKELTSVDQEKGVGVYGRYTELTAEGEVPELLSGLLAEANTRAKESVEARAERFLAEYTAPAGQGAGTADQYKWRTISHIVNVTRADEVLVSLLETEMEAGAGGEGRCAFHAAVYDTKSGKPLTTGDFMKDPDGLPALLQKALANKYGSGSLPEGIGNEVPAWTADYLGLRFYFDGGAPAVHVSVPYTALDGPAAGDAVKTPESFIAQIEKNAEYSLPFDKRAIRVEKAPDDSGREAYRIVIKDGGKEKAWWLEYADDDSDFFVFRAHDDYYFYRLQDAQDRGYVYSFASPDGGYDRFANQNAQCFDSFLHELLLAVPCDPTCVHMREKTRKYMDAKSRLNTSFSLYGHYSFAPEQGRGRTWLHFALIDDVLSIDSRNIGVRLLHELKAAALDDAGKESGEIVIPAGEVLRFLCVDGESEMYYYMSPQYSMYSSGARDYFYDCMLSDGRKVRLVNRFESGFFVDGMYLDRIGVPVILAGAQYDPDQEGPEEHYVEIGGKEYKLIMDLSLRTESGEEIDFGGDIWWLVENYIGTFSSKEEDAKLVISEDGEVSFDYMGEQFKGKLPEKRYYRTYVEIPMEKGYESRRFQIIVEDDLPDHDPTFRKIRFYSEGLPATNMPSTMPPIEVELVRE